MSSEDEVIGEIISALKGNPTNQQFIATLAEIGEKTIPYLDELLLDEDVNLRIAAIKIAEKIGEKALPFLIKSLQHDNIWGCLKAIRSLGHLGKKASESLEFLYTIQRKTKDKWLRDKALWAIEEIEQDMKDISILLAELKDQELIVRKKALTSLIHRNHFPKEIVMLCLDNLTIKDYEIRNSFADAFIVM